jgi:hypothetical protein
MCFSQISQRAARNAVELASPVNIGAVRFVRQAIEDRQFRLTVLQEMLNELRAKTHSDDGRPIVNVYREIRECLKQAAIESGDWDEKQLRGTNRDDEHADLRDKTVEQLYQEQAILLRAKAEIDAMRAGKRVEANRVIDASIAEVEVSVDVGTVGSADELGLGEEAGE